MDTIKIGLDRLVIMSLQGQGQGTASQHLFEHRVRSNRVSKIFVKGDTGMIVVHRLHESAVLFW